MKIPKTMEISGYTLEIVYKDKIMVDGQECFGYYDTVKKQIALVKGMSPARKKEIFLHEFCHFLEDIYRIHISHEGIASIALGFVQLLNNKKVKWNG